jgi:uncharacterized protein YdeI (YjbR/CyaY-like superfamily)
VQESLCFGWIDSLPRKLSDTQSMIYISKRKPKSVWSRVNKNHVATLIEQGLMTPAGLKVIEIAKANGSWDTLNASDDLIIPPDLQEALANLPGATEFFESYPPSAKRFALHLIYAAKRPETRAARVSKTAELAAQGIRVS